MKKTLFLMGLAAALTSAHLATAQQRQLFDFGWTFSQNGKAVSVDLPHDWDIYAAPDPATGATGTGGGWYPGGKGEYRKTFKTPTADIVKLHFEGVYQKAEVSVNGQKAGRHAYGYTPFTVDVTPFLKQPQAAALNELLVTVDNAAQPNCRWYSGSGIYRHVWLETMPAMHFSENGIRISTPEVSADKARVDLNIWVENEGRQTQQIDDVEVTFRGGAFTMIDDGPRRSFSPSVRISSQPFSLPKALTMVGADKGLERREIRNIPLKPGQVATYVQSFAIDKPRLWSPDDPYLYEATVRLKSEGRVIGEQRLRFGIRYFSFDAKRGFLLNGKKLLINGACVHHDDGILGAMAFDDAEIRKVRLMKQAGFNLIRTSHNPTTRAFLDACDSLGMLVIDEAFDGWYAQKTAFDYSTLIDSCYREDIRAMVLRDRNHPSVICWSIGNEVIERKDIRVITTARKLKQAILDADDTRPVTEALCAWDNDWEIYDPHAEVLDVVGYNYMIHKHEGDHRRDPNRVMWQTESYPRDAFANWALVNDHSYIVGDIVWTGLDYLGESGIGRYYYEGERPGEHYVSGGQPDWHGAYCGDVDITGWRKPVSHYRQMLWENAGSASSADEGRIYLAVREPDGYRGKIRETAWSVWPTWESWSWPGWEGKPIDVEVYTRQPEVSLYLNGKLLGTKRVSRDTQFKAVFTVDYQPGVLVAGNGSMRCDKGCGTAAPCPHHPSLATAGAPARLRLTADRQVMAADGQALAFVTVEVVDKDGRVVPDAAVPSTVSVSGAGQMVAAASADLKDREPYTSPNVTTWKGRALIALRSSGKKGRIRLTVSSSLPTATIAVKAQ